jgi:quercetin dioxygenase-like cupin family protein
LADQALSREVGTTLLHEDEHTRIWLLELPPKEATAWHAHDCDYVFVVTQPGTARCEYINGDVEEQEGDAVGSTQYRKRDVAHRLINTGPTTYQNVIVELKGTRVS